MRSSSSVFAGSAAGLVLWIAAVAAASAQEAPLSAEASDPRGLGWMEGFPPPAERSITQPDSV